MTVDPQLVPILEMMGGSGSPSLADIPVADLRMGMDASAPARNDDGLKSVDDHVAGTTPIRIYRPDVEGTPPVVAFFHGGGWTVGSIVSHDALCARIAALSKAVVVSVDYRLSPEHKFPAPLEDCVAATAWIAEAGEGLGWDGSRLAVAGDSAGGNLAAVVALMARDQGGPAIAFQALLYPVVDHHREYPSYVENAEGYMLTRGATEYFTGSYLPHADDAADWRASPIRAESLAGLPPALILTAQYDPLRDEGEAYGRRLAEAGVAVVVHRYESMIHGFLTMPLDAAAQAIDEIAAALRDAFKGQ